MGASLLALAKSIYYYKNRSTSGLFREEVVCTLCKRPQFMQFLSYEIISSKLSLIVLRMVSGVVQEIGTCVKWSFKYKRVKLYGKL